MVLATSNVAGTRASGLNADVLGIRTSRLSTAVSFTFLIDTARLELVARDFDFGADFFEACLRDFSVMTVARCVLLVARQDTGSSAA